MARSTFVLAALLVPVVAAAQTTTATTAQTPDGRPFTVTTTQSPDGIRTIEMRTNQGGDGPGVAFPNGMPPRDTPPATGTSVVRGRIIDASNGVPLRKGFVRIFGAAVREPRATTTDQEGRYEFTNLPGGEFNIQVSKPGYVDTSYGQTVPGEMSKPLKVGDKQVVEKVDFAIPRGAVITGRVLDEYGEPVAEAQVMALRSQFSPSGSRSFTAGRPAASNDIGEFRLYGLAPGQYVLSASVRPMFGGPAMAGDVGYATTYYPGTADQAQAQRLSVGAGGGLSDVTLMLVATPTARISGVVVDDSGQLVRQGSVMVTPRGGMMISTIGGPIRPDGTFVVNSVPPGEYVLRGMIQRGPGLPPESATATVSVNGADLTDVRLEPLKPITVSGRVVLDPVAARSFKPETMRLSAPSSDPGPMFGPPPPPAAVRDDLTFEFKANPGPVMVRLASPAGWMIKSVSLNGSDVTDGLTFRSDDVSGLEVELTNKVPDVSGQATNGSGDAVLDYFAIAFPQEKERWTAPGPGRTAMVRPDSEGRFRIRTLRPGEYYLVAVDHVQPGEWMDPAFMEAVHTRATRVTINEGDVRTQDLKLVQAGRP